MLGGAAGAAGPPSAPGAPGAPGAPAGAAASGADLRRSRRRKRGGYSHYTFHILITHLNAKRQRLENGIRWQVRGEGGLEKSKFNMTKYKKCLGVEGGMWGVRRERGGQ